MQILIVRSIPLSRETRDAWRSANTRIVKRSKLDNRSVSEIVQRLVLPGIINLGNLDIDFSRINCPVFNAPNAIRSVSTALALRKTLPDFLPEQTRKGPHWHKQRGMHGEGKTFHEKLLGECAAFGGDVQAHVEGTEFRVNTVGDVIVQAHVKIPLDRIGNFNWDWCGVDGIRNNGIIPLIKDAAPNIPNWERTVFGWDIIVGDNGPKVIEINTSPGVNEPTAQRIVDQIERVSGT